MAFKFLKKLFVFSLIAFLFFASQEVQQEPSGSALVLCEVYLLWPVSVPDQMWLPEPHPGQLSHQELQLPEPLPLPRVREMATMLNDLHQQTAQIITEFKETLVLISVFVINFSFLQLIFEIT